MESLFRKEVLENQLNKIQGQVLLRQSRVYTAMTTAITVAVLAALIYLSLANYARYATATGIITASKGVIKVKAMGAGLITHQYYQEGDLINAGEVLYDISTHRQRADSPDLDGRILKELNTLKTNLQEKLASSEKLAQLEHQGLLRRIQGKNSEIRQLSDQIAILKKKIELSAEGLNRQTTLLEKGYITKEQHNQYQDKHLETILRKEDSELRITSLQNQINDLKDELAEQPITAQRRTNEIKQSLTDTQQKFIEISARRDYTLLAPVSGHVATRLSQIGELVNPGDTLLSIVPTNSIIQAELFVPSSAIGFIEPGQAVTLKYSAYPHQHFGLFKGTVKQVANATSTPQEIASKATIKEAAYKVIVELASQTINAAGKTHTIRVGMNIEANILLESRSLFQWLLEPVYSLRKQ